MTKRLIVSGLGELSTEDSVRQAFTGFGRLLDVVVVRDPVTGQPHGYAFVVLDEPAAAQAAIAAMDGKFIDGQVVSVREDAPTRLPGQA
jgi:cold-inducible RNA-binding protein